MSNATKMTQNQNVLITSTLQYDRVVEKDC